MVEGTLPYSLILQDYSFHYCSKCGVTREAILEEEKKGLIEDLIALGDKHLKQLARVRELEEALKEIIKPGYGIELNDDVQTRCEYWANEWEKIREIARNALGRAE